MSLRPNLLLVCAGVVALATTAAVTVVLLHPGPILAPPDPDVAHARARVGELERELAALRGEVERLRSLSATAPSVVRTSEAAAPPSSATAVETSPSSPASGLRDPALGQSAAAWLARTFPDLFQELTADEARYLRTLDLSKQKVVAKENLALLAGLEHLVSLNLGRNATDEALQSLCNLGRLRTLDLGGSSVTLAGLRALPAENLRTLRVQDTQLTDADVDAFHRLDHLEMVKLDRTKVSDASMAALGDCRSLRHVELDSTGVTAAGLRTLLQRNPDLRRIEVRGTAVTPEEAAQLHGEFPDTVIVSEQQLTSAGILLGR